MKAVYQSIGEEELMLDYKPEIVDASKGKNLTDLWKKYRLLVLQLPKP
jgi:hypothetical protein